VVYQGDCGRRSSLDGVLMGISFMGGGGGGVSQAEVDAAIAASEATTDAAIDAAILNDTPTMILARADRESTVALGTTQADVTGMTVTFTMPDRPIKVCSFMPAFYGIGAGKGSLFIGAAITDSANVQKQLGQTSTSAVAVLGNFPSSSIFMSVLFDETELTPTTEYTFKTRASAAATGVSFTPGATQPGQMWVELA
jgi:hypothetical protein